MAENFGTLTIPFDWHNLDELEKALRTLEVRDGSKAAMGAKHCEILRSSSDYLRATRTAVFNAVKLAHGHADLAVLLLEPADEEATFHHSERLPPTLKCIDEELSESSCGTRRRWNTCIMDIRPFRSNVLREQETARTRTQQDDLAYNITECMLNALQPDVLLVCQSGTQSSSNEFARTLSSSAREFGDLSLFPLKSGKQVITVQGFHPMHAMKYTVGESPVMDRIRKAGLRFAFLQAVNIANGRVISGPGCEKLKDAIYGASQSPHLLLETGILNSSLDDRFKGCFLAEDTDLEIKRGFEELVSEQAPEDEKNLATFVSLLTGLGRPSSPLNAIGELQTALPVA